MEQTRRLYCNLYIEYYYKAKQINAPMPNIERFRIMFRKLRRANKCRVKFKLRMYLSLSFPWLYERLLVR